MDFSETIEVKVFDKSEHFSIDSYFFAYFHDILGALEQIRDAVRTDHIQPTSSAPQTVVDTTVPRHSVTNLDRAVTLPPEPTLKTASGFRLTSLLRPLQETLSRSSPQSLSETVSEPEEFTHVSRRSNSSSFIPVTTSPIEGLPESLDSLDSSSPKSVTATNDHTYPPSISALYNDPDHTSLSRESSSWGVGFPSWLKGPRRVFGGSTTIEQPSAPSPTAVTETYSSASASSSFPNIRSNTGDLAFSILETPDMSADAETTDKFRTVFAYDEKENLLGCRSFL